MYLNKWTNISFCTDVYMAHAILSYVAYPGLLYFSTLSHKRCDFKKKQLLIIKCVFLVSLHVLSKIFAILRRIQRDIIRNAVVFSCKIPVILVRF